MIAATHEEQLEKVFVEREQSERRKRSDAELHASVRRACLKALNAPAWPGLPVPPRF